MFAAIVLPFDLKFSFNIYKDQHECFTYVHAQEFEILSKHYKNTVCVYMKNSSLYTGYINKTLVQW